jgi:hypothetical protein
VLVYVLFGQVLVGQSLTRRKLGKPKSENREGQTPWVGSLTEGTTNRVVTWLGLSLGWVVMFDFLAEWK